MDASLRLFDMHCHLDFLPDPRGLALQAAATGIGALSVTVDPKDFTRIHGTLSDVPGFRVGLCLRASSPRHAT